MTLVEVLVAVAILAIALPGLLYGVLGGIRLNYSASQQASAFNLCLDFWNRCAARRTTTT